MFVEKRKTNVKTLTICVRRQRRRRRGTGSARESRRHLESALRKPRSADAARSRRAARRPGSRTDLEREVIVPVCVGPPRVSFVARRRGRRGDHPTTSRSRPRCGDHADPRSVRRRRRRGGRLPTGSPGTNQLLVDGMLYWLSRCGEGKRAREESQPRVVGSPSRRFHRRTASS